MADIRCDMCMQLQDMWRDYRMCTPECPRRRGLDYGQVSWMLRQGRNPRGLHMDSPLMQQATARMNEEEALELCEMDSIVARMETLSVRLQYLHIRAKRWRRWRKELHADYVWTPRSNSSEDDEDTSQPDAEAEPEK